MTRSKPSLKNSARCGRLLSFVIALSLISGCSSSTAPTFSRENLTQSIPELLQKEYKISSSVKLVGDTLWVYLPVENMLIPVDKKDKPRKSVKRFAIEQNNSIFSFGILYVDYLIKVVPEQASFQEFKFNPDSIKKINAVQNVLRRVIFSLDKKSSREPKFICLVAADIQIGFELREIFYYLDFQKISYQYQLISWNEYEHRVIQTTEIVQEAIGDSEGSYIDYKDITLEDFIAAQIKQRIELKFQKPEVEQNADIDKEVEKIAAYTLKAYGIKDFSAVEFNNLLTNNKIILNRQAILSRPIE